MKPDEKARLRLMTDRLIAQGKVPELIAKIKKLRDEGDLQDKLIALYALAGLEANALEIMTALRLNGEI